MTGPALLVDVGSTVIKMCTRLERDRFTPVRRIPRLPGVPPGEHVRALVGGSGVPVRLCSSANGGVRVGVLGLSRRHSVAAAARAVVSAGGNVAYLRTYADPPGPVPPVDVLVLVGGVDGTVPPGLRQPLPPGLVAAHPHGVLVWAGGDSPAVLAGLPPHTRVANVLDRHLRPHLTGLADVVREVYVGDLVDAKGLGALDGLTTGPIWPTPAVVGLAARRMTTEPVPPMPTVPFVLVDVGGATTDVFVCAELRPEHAARGAPGESVVRHVFPDLGVAVSRPALLRRLEHDPELLDLAAAVAPTGARALHAALCEGDPRALDPPVGFLACLYLALRRIAGTGADLDRTASFLVTGGACGGTPVAAVRRVLDAARGRPVARDGVLLDRAYLLWAYGLQDC